ncbi:unnamed protein product [Didymodactylos carnosus]|uniref:Uncharacterized protein n=1 Tax=Didymodactylos carnosus TaxID=1234261 RepID=A0A815UPQ3_9BILA|nr:unnamed protein product [Didymodactylos carnosus]CAF1525742.1 unnamed protein product [Didymodactylos carnosus]CAF4168006.1 unnamed protein product [Didymodactylos carnosus]CAF4384700.1 unnamed protein product [Didymodactylos carnosus]
MVLCKREPDKDHSDSHTEYSPSLDVEMTMPDRKDRENWSHLHEQRCNGMFSIEVIPTGDVRSDSRL